MWFNWPGGIPLPGFSYEDKDMTTEMPAVTGGDVAAYLGSLVAQVASLEMEVEALRDELAAKTTEAVCYFDDLVTCARALTRIDLVMGEGDICPLCLLGLVAQELEESEHAFEWAVPMVIDEMAEEDDLDDGVEEEAADAPADVRVN